MMQKMKDYINKVQVFIIEKRNFWYWFVMVIMLMMLANTELLSTIIPRWAMYLINAVLTIVTTVYVRLLIVNLKERIKEKKTADKVKLYSLLEQSFKDIESAVHNVNENVTNNTEVIKNELRSSKEMILADVEAKKKEILKELISVQKHEKDACELLKNKIDQFEVANKNQLENSTSKVLNVVNTMEKNLKEDLSEQKNLINRNAESNKTNINKSRETLLQEIKSNGNKAEKNVVDINKNIEEVRNMLTESVTKLLETTDASLQTVQKENIDNIANQTKRLIEKLDNVMEENKRGSTINLEKLQKTCDIIVDKIGAVDEANQKNTKEYQEGMEEKLALTDKKIMKEFANIGTGVVNQTSELIEKLDNVMEENKKGSTINLEGLRKTCDILIDKISHVDQVNQAKNQDYYNRVEERLNASDDRVMRELANIKELAKEMEEKRTEEDLAAFDGLHAKANDILSSNGNLASKLNMVSEALEGFENRTASEIAENSAIILQEVKDGVIQSTSHMNDVSERVIEIIQENDTDMAEKMDYRSKEILSTISGNRTRTQENYDSLVSIFSEIKLLFNAVETEILSVEKGSAELTEELKKSVTAELRNVGDELSKIEGNQKDIIAQIMEVVDSKLLELNQELVKQANSILDKSDENSDYVSEKYNRVFDQIQSVAKESKILINRVNDAIEENKNAIIQSQNVVTDCIGSHFQNIKSKEKELELLEAVVERNFLNINRELEITRGQLSSLNSLSVLIKNLSEKKEDKVEKKQNRIETIENPENGLTVKNEYKQDKLITSQMFRGSKKVYDVFYGNRGEITRTKNYDKSEKVSIEMTYYPNGQVKERKEYISGKVELSKFDANGNKIK